MKAAWHFSQVAAVSLGCLMVAILPGRSQETRPVLRPLELRSDIPEGGRAVPEVLYDRSFAPVMPEFVAARQNAAVGGDWLATASGYLHVADLAAGPPLFRAALETSVSPANGRGPDVVLLHFGDLPMDAVRKAVRQAGVTPLGQIPNNAYVVSGMDDAARAALTRAGATVLTWTPAFFVSPLIGITPVRSLARARDPELDLLASIFPGGDEDLVLQKLEAMGATIKGVSRGVVSFRIHIDDLRTGLESLTGMPLRALAEAHPILSADEDTAGGIQIGKFRSGDRPYTEAGIDGSSQIVGLTDTGLSLDTAVLADGTPGLPGSGVTNAAGPGHRKVLAYIQAQDVPGNVGGQGDLLSCDGITGTTHGHLVASIIAGNASEILSDVRSLAGFEPHLYGTATRHAVDGVAPGARIYFIDDQIAADCTATDQIEVQAPGSLSANAEAARLAGARIHNFSLEVTDSESSYTIEAQDLDSWLFANTDFLVVTAAGNQDPDRNHDLIPDFGTVTSPGTAKNVLAVGSSGYPNNALDSRDSVLPGFPNNGIAMITRPAGGAKGSGQGPAAFTLNAEGGANWRIKPDVMAPGDETPGNQRLVSPTTCISGDNDQTGEVQCGRLPSGAFGGTSFAAAAASGAAALVRDYFARGFAPAGMGGGAPLDLSGPELKAALIASADLMTGNPGFSRSLIFSIWLSSRIPRHLSTFTPEQGYGRIQLNKLLPLNSEPGTPSYIETELVTLPLATTVSRLFTVVNAGEELRCVVSWYDPETTLAGPDAEGNLVRNIDMVVTQCGTDGCGDVGDARYFGNYFTEDADFNTVLLDLPAEFGCSNLPNHHCDPDNFNPHHNCGDSTATCDLVQPAITEDCNGNGILDFSEFSLPVSASPLCRGGGRDVNNNNEAVFLSPAQLTQGGLVRVDLIWESSSEVAPPASTEAGLVCTGGIATAMTPPSLRLSKSEYSCADALEVHAIVPGGSTLAALSTGLTLTSYGSDGVTVLDSESTLNFSDSSGSGHLFSSLPMAVVDTTLTPALFNDRVLSVESGGHVEAAWGTATASARVRCSPNLSIATVGRRGTNASFGIRGGCDPLGRVDPRAILFGTLPGSGTALTGDLFMDAHEDLTYQVAFTNLEEGEPLQDVRATLQACQAGSAKPDGSCIPAGSIEILDAEQNIGNVPAGRDQVVSFSIHVDGRVSFPDQVDMLFSVTAARNGLPAASRTIFHHLLNADTWSFPHEDPAVSGVSHYSTDFPTGGREIRVYAGEFFDSENPDLAAEEFIFQDMTTAAHGGGNATILGFNTTSGRFDQPIVNNMPWTFDLDREGFGARRRFDSDAGDNLELEEFNVWQWNNTGECGFQSNDATQPDFNRGTDGATCRGRCPEFGTDTGSGGMWHTGFAEGMLGQPGFPDPGTRTGFDLGCEDYDLPGFSDHSKQVVDTLSSPIFFRVHENADANGFAYQVEFTRFAFNLQIDIDVGAIFGYELDPDTTTSQPVDPLDFGWLASDQGRNGFLLGHSDDPYIVFNPNNPHEATSALANGETLAEQGSGRNIRSVQGPGSPGSFFENDNPDKAPARSFGEVPGLLSGRGIFKPARRGAGGFPVRNYDNELGDQFAGTFEDIFGPNETRDPGQNYPISGANHERLLNQRSSFQTNFTAVLTEVFPSSFRGPSYGAGIDDVVVEWREVHPVADRTPCSDPSTWTLDEDRMPTGGSTTCIGGVNSGRACEVDADCPGSQCTARRASGCAAIAWDRSTIMSPETTLTLTVMDTNAQYGPDGLAGTGDEQAVDTDGDGFVELRVPVHSDVDMAGEIITLTQIQLAGPLYRGSVRVSTTWGLTSDTDGTVFIQENGDGENPVAITAQYSDQDINVQGLGFPATPCPDNPLVAMALTRFVGADVMFVTATISDTGPNADGDSIADPGETIDMSITLVNQALDTLNEKVDMEDVLITLLTPSNQVGPDRAVACILEGQSFMGSLPSGVPRVTSPDDSFRWVVGDVERTSVNQVLQAHFSLGIQGHFTDSLGVERRLTSFATPQSFAVNLDLDIRPGGGRALAANFACVGGTSSGHACTGSSDCPSGFCDPLPAYLATGGDSLLAGKVGYFEGFEGADNMAGRNFAGSTMPGTGFVHAPALNAAGGYLDGGTLDAFMPGPLTPGAAPGNDPDTPQGSSAVDGSRCQYNDIQGPSKHDNSEAACRPWDGSDWHVNDNKAFTGTKSLYGGIDGDEDLGMDDSFDTYHTNLLAAAFSGAFHVGVGGGATLSIAHIIAVADDRTFSVPRNGAVDRGVLEWTEVNPVNGTPLSGWNKLNGFVNNYGHFGTPPLFSNCVFDSYDDFYDTENALGNTPGFSHDATNSVGVTYNADDISSEDDYFDPNDPLRLFGPSASCFPEFVFTSMGDYTSTDITRVGEAFTDGELGETGSGVWVKSLFSLDEAAGRTIRVRFVLTSIDIGPGFTWADLFGNSLGNGTRGWRVDDVAVAGVVDAPTILAVDTRTSGPNACPVDPDTATPANEAACDTVTAVAGSDQSTTVSGTRVILDGAASFASQCVNGHLEYQWRVGGQLLQPFSTDPIFTDAPLMTTEYTLDVRCSTDPACNGSDSLLVTPADQLEASGIPEALLSLSADSTTVSFVAAQPPGPSPCVLSLLETTLAGAAPELRTQAAGGEVALMAGTLRDSLCNAGPMTDLGGDLSTASQPLSTLTGEINGYLATALCDGIPGTLGRLERQGEPGGASRGRVIPDAVSACP